MFVEMQMTIQGFKMKPGEELMAGAGPGPLPWSLSPASEKGIKHIVGKPESYRRGLGKRAYLYAGKGRD